MRSRIYLVSALVLLSAALASAFMARGSVDWGLEPIAADVSVGQVRQATTARHTFELRNRTSDAITIARVSKGCDCTTAEPSRRDVPPGESVLIPVEWQIGERRGATDTSLAVLYTQSAAPAPRHRKVELTLSAQVLPDVLYEPESVEFTRGMPRSQYVEFSAGELCDFRVRSAYCTHRAFRAWPETEIGPVTVRFDPAAWDPDPRANITAELVVRTTSERQPEMRIPLSVRE